MPVSLITNFFSNVLIVLLLMKHNLILYKVTVCAYEEQILDIVSME